MPDEIKHLLDFAKMELSSNTFVMAGMKKIYSDIIYNCPLNEETEEKICFILEHKSYKPGSSEDIHLQLLSYWIGAIQQKRKQKIVPPPLPIPIYLFHGENELKTQPLWNKFKNHTSCFAVLYQSST